MAQLVSFFFQLQTQIKLYHWQTTSYARHKASDELVEKMIELSDKFMEVYMGRYGRPTMTEKESWSLKNLTEAQMVGYIKKCIAYLSDEVPKFLHKKDHDLISIRDDMLVELHQTLYLFTLE